jgi:threonine synthase
MSTKFHYRCTDCGKTYAPEQVKYLCPVCGAKFVAGMPLCGVLEAILDYDYIKKHFNKASPNLDLFSVIDKKYYPPYPVGNTAFSRAVRLQEKLGYSNLWLKNDGLNPSGSLKDRASFLVVAEAIRSNEEKIITASTGNAASALAAVAAAAGKKAIIFVPEKAPIAKMVQIIQYGAEIIPVRGTYDDAFRLSLEYTAKHGGLNRNTAYHPLTIEGKKTAGLEIFAQNNCQAPNAIIVPVGDGVIISGIYKAFYDLKMAGLITKMPKLICVQAQNSNAIHNYIETGKYHDAKNPSTIADSISVTTPSNAHMARRAVMETGGFSLLVSDEEILAAQTLLASTTGIFAEPAAAATVAGLQKISQNKKDAFKKDEQIVLLITGHGLKDINAAMKNIKMPKPVDA